MSPGPLRRLVVFARRPEVGRVKTRLSPALPAALARDLYAALLGDTFAAAAACAADAREVLWADEPGDAPSGFAAGTQRGADLGARLAAAFAGRVGSPGDACVIVGSDAPGLTAALLDAAFAALARAPLVLGPAGDGGYWLVGLSRRADALFAGVDWSTPRVHAQTLARAASLGLAAESLPPLDDVDEPADLAALVARLAAGDDAACGANTRAALRAMGLSR